jgi:DNA-binding NarL/FixJ family response regulator
MYPARVDLSTPRASQMKIFIVEDSAVLRDRLIMQITRNKNAQIIGTADEAVGAIDQIREVNPDLVVLDIRLRQGNGYQVLKAIKTVGKPPIVLVLTNFPYPQYRQIFLSSGADYFFDKSTEFDRALDVLKQLTA